MNIVMLREVVYTHIFIGKDVVLYINIFVEKEVVYTFIDRWFVVYMNIFVEKEVVLWMYLWRKRCFVLTCLYRKS